MSVRSRRGSDARRTAPAVVGAGSVLLMVVAALLLPEILPAAPSGLAGLVSSETIPPWNTWVCNPPNLSPAAVSASGPNVGLSLSRGAAVGAAYEYRVVNYTPSEHGIALAFPSMQVVLPLSPSGSLVLTIPPRHAAVPGGYWTAPPAANATVSLGSNLTFATRDGYLSSAKYAVMAKAASGSLTLEVRWHWWYVLAGGGPTHDGPWSVPSLHAKKTRLPSIFYPAPTVRVRSTNVSGKLLTTDLTGFVANTSFRMVLEFPRNGTEIRSIWENTSVGAKQFNATLPITRANGTSLHAGSYLIHVHDVCGAIVAMISVQVAHGFPTAPSVADPVRTVRA